MANGNTNSTPVTWSVGETSTSIPAAHTTINTGTTTPTAAPNGAPIFIDTSTDDVFFWNGSSWFGPYGTHT